MANRLEMAKIKAILTLHQHGWSCRRIGRELGIRHETASKYIQAAGASEPATAPPGSDDPKPATALGRSPIRGRESEFAEAIVNPSGSRFWPCSIWAVG